MQKKVWHKPLHQRKIWRQTSLSEKILYYMQPFATHLFEVWLQPLPFPTMLKFIYSCVLLMFILVPIIYPTVVSLFFYAILQFVVERHAGIDYPQNWDLLSYAHRVYYYRVTNPQHVEFAAMYMERWRVLGTAIASSIDYMRLAVCLAFEFIEE